MAELDISGFVTPEQQFAGLYKFADTLEKQQAAKKKDAQEKEAKKKVLNKYIADIDAKDYLTGTPEDPVITQKIFDAKNDAYKFVLENPGADQADLEYHVNNLVKDVATSSQNLKQTKLQADKYYDSVKDNKSIDKQKFYDNYMKNAYYNEDGSLKDLAKVDPSQDFLTPTLNSDIYTTEGFNNAISNMATNTFSDKYKVRTPSGTTREANLSVTSPTFYQPSLDDKGVLAEQKFVPKHGYATINGQERIQIPKTDAMGNPILDKDKKPIMEDMKIAQDDAWQYFTTNPETKGYLNVAMQKYAKENNLPVTSTQVDNYGRNLAYKIMESSPNIKGSYKEEEQKLAPNIKINMGGGGSGSKEPTINDVYDRLFAFTNRKLDEYKNNETKVTDSKTGKLVDKNYIQANLLDTDIRNVVLKEARNAIGDKDLGIKDIKIKLDENGMMGIYDKNNKLQAQLTPQGVNLPVTPKAGGKEKEIKRIPGLQSYSKELQLKISNFMKKNKLGEQDAIRELINAGYLPK
jgi:hypothetical protein